MVSLDLTSFLVSCFVIFASIWIYDRFVSGSPPKERLRSYQKEGESKPGEGKPRRAIGFTELVSKPNKEVDTLFSLLQYASKKYPNNKAVGWRDLVKIHNEEKEITKIEGGVEKKEKKIWSFFELSPYIWLNYSQFFDRVKNFGYALTSPEKGLKKNDLFGIYSATQVEWILAAHGAWSQGITVVTAYANLGEDGLIHSLNQGEISHLFTNHDLFPMIVKVLPQTKFLKVIIYTGEPKKELLEELEKQGLSLFSLEQFEKIGKSVKEKKENPPTPDDIAVIMYTSGTTDLPKGVMITHGNIIAAIAGATHTVDIYPTDVYIAYLPLAHVLELAIENLMLYSGVALGYANNKTLTDASVKQCKGDLRELAPTLMAGVPVVWERIRKGALSKIETGSPLKQKLFSLAYKQKLAALKSGKKTPIWDALVFKNFTHQVGGRLRIMLSGGAPVSAQTHEFLRVAFGCPVIQGYGLTEVTGVSCLLPLDHLATERIGAPLPSCEIKLVDVSELGYTSSDKPHARGEVWIRGGIVTKGYFKNPEKTNEEFKDGWFSTGDIGEWHNDGTLSIIDRKKNLVKLSHGEYIAVEKLESKYQNSQFVENICVYGDGLRDYAVAIIRPNEVNLSKWARERGIVADFHALVERKDVKAIVLDSLQQIAKTNSLKEFEVVKNIHLTADEWTPENDLLTAAMKLKRQNVIPKYRKEIDSLY